MKNFVTSDWHHGHKNISGENGFVSTRKHFKNVEEMNETIIKNFNSVVSKEDHTYHLGDISLNLKPKEVHEILCKMNGSMELYKGNHDTTKLFKYLKANNFRLPNGRMKYDGFHEVGTIIKYEKKVFYITHFPMTLGETRPIYRNICGHIHDEEAYHANILNVGIDSPEIPKLPFGTPILLEDAFRLCNEKWNKKFGGI